MSEALAQLSRAVQMLAEARTLDELTHIRAMAQAAEQYARAEKMGDEAERYAREIRVRAARKAGELLKIMLDAGERAHSGLRTDLLVPDQKVPPTLSQLGISHHEAARWQQLATIPEDEFETKAAEGWGETAIARGMRSSQSKSHGHSRTQIPQTVPLSPKTKTNGYTFKQSLTGLQQAAIQIQGLAEALDGGLLGDWARLYAAPEAQSHFDVIAESLPLLVARLKRALAERGRAHGAA